MRCSQGLVGSSPTRRMRSLEDRSDVLASAAAGLSASAIAARTGLPRSTVRDWLGSGPETKRREWSGAELAARDRLRYAYLLGIYLGDGYIARMRRTWCLRVFLDDAYPAIVESVSTAVEAISPSGRSARYASSSRGSMVVVYSYGRHWLAAFPQHGAGHKHERLIELAPWQARIVDEHPWALLRGLIHSDGSRSLNTTRVRGAEYRYPRYQFSNRSEDILRIFTKACDRVGCGWTRMNGHAISVARRDDVRLMDEFIGPKA